MESSGLQLAAFRCLMMLQLTAGTGGYFSTDVLWQSCNTTICGRPALSFRCESTEKILINNVPSGSVTEANRLLQERSYMNLRRMCMGMSTCEPIRFCETHSTVNNGQNPKEFNVNYVCVRDTDIIKQCESSPIRISQKQGFITNPHYPSETQFRTCKWEIKVPEGHFVHIYLHEILLTAGSENLNTDCDGVIFMTKSTCAGQSFPTFPLCDVRKVNSSITACGDVTIFLSGVNPDPIRFWFSFYVNGKTESQTCYKFWQMLPCVQDEENVVPVPDLRYVHLYDRGLTCTVTAKPNLIYSNVYFTEFNKTESNDEGANTTVASIQRPEQHGNYGLFIGLAVGIIFLIIIIVFVRFYLRRCKSYAEQDKKSSLSNSNSQTNCSEIQKRPLPVTDDTPDEGQPFLQPGYSAVADEIPRTGTNTSPASPTYAEIDECAESEEKEVPKPKPKLVNKRSLVDNSKRELPAKPIEEDNGKPKIYYEIDDTAKDSSTEKALLGNKNKKSDKVVPKQQDKGIYGYKYEKKLSNASNIYAECEEVQNKQNEKTYIDMTHKQESPYVPYSKDIKDTTKDSKEIAKDSKDISKFTKDKVNQTKRILTKDKPSNSKQNSPYMDCANLKKPSDFKKIVAPKAKNESLSSDSDSDDISMIENELYEPFESAKV